MPFDGYDNSYGDADFDVAYLPTRMPNKVYVVRTDKDEAIGIVGKDYPKRVDGHKKMLDTVRDTWRELLPDWVPDASITTRVSRNGAWCLEEVKFPKQPRPITTNKQSTELIPRIVYWTSLDGLTSNNLLFGAIDMFCTNGMVIGNYSSIKKKNSKNFIPSLLSDEMDNAKETFLGQVNYIQSLADKTVSFDTIKRITQDLFNERKAKEMMSSIMDEVSVRGSNMFAVHSAFTQYASHSDRFGFRQTANQNNLIERQFKRTTEVSRWLEHDAFKVAA